MYHPEQVFMSRRHATASRLTVSPCMIPLGRMPSSTSWTMHPAPSSSLLQSSFLALWRHCPGSSILSKQSCTGGRQTRSPYRSLILPMSPVFSHDFQSCPQPLTGQYEKMASESHPVLPALMLPIEVACMLLMQKLWIMWFLQNLLALGKLTLLTQSMEAPQQALPLYKLASASPLIYSIVICNATHTSCDISA